MTYTHARTTRATGSQQRPEVNKLQAYNTAFASRHKHNTEIIIISYHIVDLKRQNRLKVGTDKPKPKVNMLSVSDEDVRKKLREKPRELGAKGAFRLGLMFVTSSDGACEVFGRATGKTLLNC